MNKTLECSITAPSEFGVQQTKSQITLLWNWSPVPRAEGVFVESHEGPVLVGVLAPANPEPTEFSFSERKYTAPEFCNSVMDLLLLLVATLSHGETRFTHLVFLFNASRVQACLYICFLGHTSGAYSWVGLGKPYAVLETRTELVPCKERALPAVLVFCPNPP